MNNKSGSESEIPWLKPCGHEPPQGASQLHGVCLFCYRDRLAHLQKLCEEQRSDNETLKNENELLIRRFNDTFGQFYGMDEQLRHVITTERERADKLEVRVRELDARVEEQKAELDEMNALIALQRTRYGVAEKWWRSRKPVERELQSPDLGQLLDELIGVIEEQRGEIERLKAWPLLTRIDKDGNSETHPIDRVVGLQDIEIMSLKSQLATQTERVKELELDYAQVRADLSGAYEDIKVQTERVRKLTEALTALMNTCDVVYGQDASDKEHEAFRKAWELSEQALNQDSLGDWKNKEVK